MAEMLGERLLDWHVGALGGVLVPFLIAAAIKTLQGSSLVAAITAAGMVQPLLVSLGLSDANGKALAALAVGAGAMAISHVNDEFFWLVGGSRRAAAAARGRRAQSWHAAAGPYRRGGAAAVVIAGLAPPKIGCSPVQGRYRPRKIPRASRRHQLWHRSCISVAKHRFDNCPGNQ